jgi:hypothetical protein
VGIILKFDFEKVYDMVNWDFLLECHKAKGFLDKWCGFVKQILVGRTISVKLNNEIGTYFTSSKGVQ